MCIRDRYVYICIALESLNVEVTIAHVDFISLLTGDITQKGYEKKRTRLLAPYVPKQAQGMFVFHFVLIQCMRMCVERGESVMKMLC